LLFAYRIKGGFAWTIIGFFSMRIPTATSGVPSYGTSLLFSFSEIASNRGEVFKTGINRAEILRKVYLVQKMT
jgi:hypothetical protein